MEEYHEVSPKGFVINLGEQSARTHLILFTAASLNQDLIIFQAARHNIIITDAHHQVMEHKFLHCNQC